MSDHGPVELTQLLQAASAGDHEAEQRVWQIVEPELHRMASRQIARDGVRSVLQPTSMVAEAYLRLVGRDGSPIAWANHRHFFAAAAETLRRIRVDRARSVGARKRGGDAGTEPLQEQNVAQHESMSATDELALDEALTKFEAEHPRAASVVKLRYYSELTREEIAQILEMSPRSVDNEWRFARSWLFAEMSR
ncbi:MAG: ECF-type sigma factor [Planctomycetota bacterium]